MDDLFSWVVSRRRLVGRLGAAGLAYGVLPPGAAACALGARRCGPCWDGIAPCNGYTPKAIERVNAHLPIHFEIVSHDAKPHPRRMKKNRSEQNSSLVVR